MFMLDVFRNHKKAIIITLVVLLILALPVYFLTRPKAPQYVTALVERGDLQQTVEAVGTVTSERDLQLKFPNPGILASVGVKEGDVVRAGRILAQLRSGTMGAAVAMQAANLQSALADLRKIEEGTRPEDIAITQAALTTAEENLAQAKDQLTSLEQEAKTSLGGQVETARSSIATQMVAGETALSAVQDILDKTIVADAIVKSGSPGRDAEIRQYRQTALTSIQGVRIAATSAQDYHDMLGAMQSAQTAISQTMTALDQLYATLSSLQETAYFSASVRETYRTTISTQRGLVQGTQSALSTTQSTLQTASATYDTRISGARATITADEGAKQRAQADLLSKQAGSRPADIDSARARVKQAQAGLAQAQATFSDTILRSPVDGTVTHVNVKVGESTPISDPAVTVLGNTPFRVEMYVSEVDVPKLARTQSGTIELDAFPDVKYKVTVSEIDTSPTLVDGVSKYKMKLDFLYPHAEFKIGMTGDVTVVTGERKAVVRVPGRAVLTKEDGSKVVRVLEKGKSREVTVMTGMDSASGDVEITSGLQGGETIIVLEK